MKRTDNNRRLYGTNQPQNRPECERTPTQWDALVWIQKSNSGHLTIDLDDGGRRRCVFHTVRLLGFPPESIGSTELPEVTQSSGGEGLPVVPSDRLTPR